MKVKKLTPEYIRKDYQEIHGSIPSSYTAYTEYLEGIIIELEYQRELQTLKNCSNCKYNCNFANQNTKEIRPDFYCADWERKE